MPFQLVRNDITRMPVDAIVNAANNSLLGGGGVDGAIHRAAGPELLDECRTLGGCETGKAKITKGYRLPCRYVIHTVGPIWMGGQYGEEEKLVSCYRESLKLAAEYGAESVAFPLISSGAYGYPKEQALKVATDTIREFLADHDMSVSLVVFDRGSYLLSREMFEDIRSYIDDTYMRTDYEERERRRRFAAESLFFNRRQSYESAPSAPASLMMPDVRPKAAGKGAPELVPKDEAPIDAEPCAPDTDLERYVSQLDEGFRDMLLRKIDEKNMTDAECYKRANIDRKLFNKIKNQPDYRPGKATVLALAVSLRLPLAEVEEMLMKAGFSLSPSSKFDLVVKYHIIHGIYDVYQINEALFSFDQRLLGSFN